MIIENLNLHLEINYTVRQENIIPKRQTITTLQFLVTVSQILVENVNTISIEISFLEEQDDAIIQVGVTDILNNLSHDQTTQLMCNLRKISAKCKSYGVKHVFFFQVYCTPQK